MPTPQEQEHNFCSVGDALVHHHRHSRASNPLLEQKRESFTLCEAQLLHKSDTAERYKDEYAICCPVARGLDACFPISA